MADSDAKIYFSNDGALHCEGNWTLRHLDSLERQLPLSPLPEPSRVICDAGKLITMDTGGAWLLWRILTGLEQRRCRVELIGLSPDLYALVQTAAKNWPGAEALTGPGRAGWLEKIGRFIIHYVTLAKAEGLMLLAEARAETGLPVVTEVVAPEDVDLVARHADMLQVGSRKMQNFRLLSAVGAQPRPVLLKRGLSATIEELLLAAEYVSSAGKPRVVLCERGIRTFETATRNTLDVAAVPVLKEKTHLPVIVDPSHAAGRRELVRALARAAIAAGADGLIVEVHHAPERAASDGRQSLTLEGFQSLMHDLARLAAALG